MAGLSDLRIGRLCSREDIAVLISLRSRVDPWAIAGPEGMKNSNDITRYLPSCNTIPFVHINNEYNITKELCVCVCVCVCARVACACARACECVCMFYKT
jgi:hypothetical protein